MAKFITTTEISHLIETLIREAKDFIFLITAYVKIHSRLKKIISEKSIKIYIVCRQNDLHSSELEWLRNNKINLFFDENLHAKAYLNEEDAILTSMNLYEFSMVNNVEFGIHLKKNEDKENYKSLLSYCDSLVNYSRQKILASSNVKKHKPELHKWISATDLRAIKLFTGKTLLEIARELKLTVEDIDLIYTEKGNTYLMIITEEHRYLIPLSKSVLEAYENEEMTKEYLAKCYFKAGIELELENDDVQIGNELDIDFDCLCLYLHEPEL